MRIACLHVPQFALQCVTRSDPARRGAPMVVVGAEVPRTTVTRAVGPRGAPIVQACSRAAWIAGVRVGMSATAARAASPELEIVTVEPQRERDTVRAIADALLVLTGVVDVGGRSGPGGAHLALYCEVPSKMRGTTFGERVIETLEVLGLMGRVGIADDRFTAWVASQERERDGDDDGGITSVPRGGSAAFLAPRPLSLLAITPEVQHMLESLGVATLGEFAALPAPSVVSRSRGFEVDYQALARGEGGHALRPYAPDAPIREEIVVTTPGSAIALLAERIALRLAGRGRAAAKIDLAIVGPAGERIVAVAPVRGKRAGELFDEVLPTKVGEASAQTAAEEIAEALAGALDDEAAVPGNVWRMRGVVTGETLVDAGAGDASDAAASSAAEPAIVDTLSLVLSSTGGSLDLALGPVSPLPLFSGASLGVLRAAERRDGHRRTRRGKQRRRADSLIQPKLFKNLK